MMAASIVTSFLSCLSLLILLTSLILVIYLTPLIILNNLKMVLATVFDRSQLVLSVLPSLCPLLLLSHCFPVLHSRQLASLIHLHDLRQLVISIIKQHKVGSLAQTSMTQMVWILGQPVLLIVAVLV